MPGGLTLNAQIAFAGILVLLAIATLAVAILVRLMPREDFTELRLRLRSWWVMLAVFFLAVVLGRAVSLAFLAFVSFLALKEYLSLIPTRQVDRGLLCWAYAAIPIQYYWIATGRYEMFIIFVPLYMLLMLSTSMVLTGIDAAMP